MEASDDKRRQIQRDRPFLIRGILILLIKNHLKGDSQAATLLFIRSSMICYIFIREVIRDLAADPLHQFCVDFPARDRVSQFIQEKPRSFLTTPSLRLNHIKQHLSISQASLGKVRTVSAIPTGVLTCVGCGNYLFISHHPHGLDSSHSSHHSHPLVKTVSAVQLFSDDNMKIILHDSPLILSLP